MSKKIIKLRKNALRTFVLITALSVVYANSGASYLCDDFRTRYGKDCLKKVEQGLCPVLGIKCVDAADEFLACCKDAKLSGIPVCWKTYDPCKTPQ